MDKSIPNLYDTMLELFKQFGWEIKTGAEQKNGSPSDIYAEINDEHGAHSMRIDDGNCHNELEDACYHIYASGKIFEGRIGTPEDFSTVMKVLGFERTAYNFSRYNFNEPKTYSVFRSRDLESKHVGSHKEVVPMGYVNSIEEFDGYVKMEYPKAKKIEIASHRGSGNHYYSDGQYNIFYHEMNKLNKI